MRKLIWKLWQGYFLVAELLVSNLLGSPFLPEGPLERCAFNTCISHGRLESYFSAPIISLNNANSWILQVFQRP
jgi:hypothetical protein